MQIEKNVPLPTSRHDFKIILDMEPGDSLLVETNRAPVARALISDRRKEREAIGLEAPKFVTRVEKDGDKIVGVRFWRKS